jgi:hypothetical protein
MIDSLTTILSGINNGTIPVVRNSLLIRHLFNGREDIGQNTNFFSRKIGQTLEVFFGNKQIMNRRLGANVFKGQNPIVLINFG